MSKYLDAQGRYRTESLFAETTKAYDSYPPEFTLSDKDRTRNGAPLLSLKRLYMEAGDPTEYNFAMQVFGSWEHWQKLCKCKWFQPHLDKWRIDLEAKVVAEAVAAIREISKDIGNKGRLTAAKWLAERQFSKGKKGRPSKEDIARETQKLLEHNEDVGEDAERLGITIN